MILGLFGALKGLLHYIRGKYVYSRLRFGPQHQYSKCGEVLKARGERISYPPHVCLEGHDKGEYPQGRRAVTKAFHLLTVDWTSRALSTLLETLKGNSKQVDVVLLNSFSLCHILDVFYSHNIMSQKSKDAYFKDGQLI